MDTDDDSVTTNGGDPYLPILLPLSETVTETVNHVSDQYIASLEMDAKKYIEKKLNVTATIRNWNTVTQLLAMYEDLE